MKPPIKLTPELQQYFEFRYVELQSLFIHTPPEQLEAAFIDKMKSIFEDGGVFLKKGIMNSATARARATLRDFPLRVKTVDLKDLCDVIENTTVNSIIEKMNKAKNKGGMNG